MSTVEILTWADVRDKIAAVNPWLWEIISDIKGVNKYHIIRATYPFGDDVIYKGNFFFNINGQSVPWESNKISRNIKKLLDYSWKTTPFGVVTNNSVESHIHHSNHILPFRLLLPGKTFSLSNIFDKESSYFITGLYSTKAGCRSMLMLAKITHALSSARLTKKYGVTRHLLPKELSDHWLLFNEIAHSPTFKTKWEAEITLFSHEFINPIRETLNARHELLSGIWREIAFQRNEKTYNFIWSIFFDTLPLSLKNDTFIIQTVKHLILIAIQQAPGFVPEDSNLSGPITELIDVFLNCYKIRFHLPVFMRLEHFDGKNPVYYSLYKSTFIYEAPERKATKQTINELIKIRSVLFSFRDYILNNKFEHSLKDTSLYKILSEVDFDFYHPDGTGDIKNSIEELVKADKRFTNLPYDDISKYGLAFPIHSMFFHGCVKVGPKHRSRT
jgi:hypothetical protein